MVCLRFPFLLIEMIRSSRLQHNLVKWLVTCLRGQKATCLYQQLSLSRQLRAGVPQGSVISPALFNHFVSDCPISDLDMTSHDDDFSYIPAKDAVSPWWLDLTTVGQMASPQPEGNLHDHTHVIHLTHLIFSPRCRPRPV